MKRVVFARLPGDSRIRYSGPLPFSDSVPLSGDTSYPQLKQQFWTSGNKGNTLIGESVGRLFQLDRTQSCYCNILDLCGAGWTPARISQEFNERFDYVVFAMANSVQPGLGQLHQQPAEIVELLKTNVIVLGLGKQSALPQDLKALDPATVRLLRAFNEKARVFGVRGAETEAWLRTMHFERARALGCPSLYVYPKHICALSAPKASSADSSLITAGHLHDRDRSRPLLDLLKERNVHYILQDELFQAHLENAFAREQDFYNDVTGELDRAVAGRIFEQLHRVKLPFQGYWYFQSPDTWRAFCARHDLYVGDRFHGGVAALQAGLPALILWSDLRVQEMTGFFGIPNLALADARTSSLEDLVAECLSRERITRFQETYRKRFEEFRQTMQEAGLPLAVQLSPESEAATGISPPRRWWARLAGKT